jgi:DNA processing protein
MGDAELARSNAVFNHQTIQGIREQASKYQQSHEFMARQFGRAAHCNGSIVTLDDPLYPRFLSDSSFCHPILYCIGDLAAVTACEKLVAIVGTRHPAPESCAFARSIASEFARHGWIVVSGMAKGIDTEAHQGALAAGGRTIAVLGCGPDVIYPRESAELHSQIARRGLILSEFPFGARVDELKLKKRNKTIVAATRGTFLVETDLTGGAMNAAAACREQNKPLLTILPEWPSRIGGNRKATSEGAFVISVGPDSFSHAASLLESGLPGLTVHLFDPQ